MRSLAIIFCVILANFSFSFVQVQGTNVENDSFRSSEQTSEKNVAQSLEDRLTVGGSKESLLDSGTSPGVIISHTYFERQQPGSMGRMVAVGPEGYCHFTWMELRNYPYPGNPRWVMYNCKKPDGTWLGCVEVDGGTNVNAGHSNIGLLHDGRAVVTYHNIGTASLRGCCLSVDDNVCSGSFTKHYDLPDSIAGGFSGGGFWAKVGVAYILSEDRDYFHIVQGDGGLGSGQMEYAYLRCYFSADTLICESPGGYGPYLIYTNILPTSPRPIAPFDSGSQVSSVVTCSRVSNKVAIVYTKNKPGTETDFDVFYMESTNNGQDWLDGSNWPGTKINITQYQTPSDTERAYNDVAACYDYSDNLHILWSGIRSIWPLVSSKTTLYHWSQATDKSRIAAAYWEGANPGNENKNICKMSVGVRPRDNYLYSIWTQFNPNDRSTHGFSNGEIYASVSSDGGLTWNLPTNLTQTPSPGCSGNCESDHWSSLAEVVTDTLHIQYINDQDAGIAVFGEGVWTNNPVMYFAYSVEGWKITPGNDINAPAHSQVTAVFHVKYTGLAFDSCYLEVSDSLGWEIQPESYRLILSPGQEDSVGFKVQIPSVSVGAKDKISLTCVSLTDPFVVDTASLYVSCNSYNLTIIDLSDIGNDQGKQVHIDWSSFPASDPLVTDFSVFRRKDSLLISPPSASTFDRVFSLTYPPGQWEWLITIPAFGETLYSVVVPTLKDSTIAEGMYWSAFFIRAGTNNPIVYFDSPVDSGYSLDNLSPSPPTGLFASHAPASTKLTWHATPIIDFDYHTVYRDTIPGFPPSLSNRVGFTIDSVFIDSTAQLGRTYHYLVTATDFSGNESDPSNEATGVRYITGDANTDGVIDVGDVLYLINYLFKGGQSPRPLQAGDANCNGVVEIGDVLYLINYLFKGGSPPSC